MIVLAIRRSVIVANREIRDDDVGRVDADVDHRGAVIVRVSFAPVATQLREFDARLVAIFADERNVTRRDHHLLPIDAVADQDRAVLVVFVRDRIDRILNFRVIAAAILRDDDARRFAHIHRLDAKPIEVGGTKQTDFRADPLSRARDERAAERTVMLIVDAEREAADRFGRNGDAQIERAVHMDDRRPRLS